MFVICNDSPGGIVRLWFFAVIEYVYNFLIFARIPIDQLHCLILNFHCILFQRYAIFSRIKENSESFGILIHKARFYCTNLLRPTFKVESHTF